jgi:hypothetical protein
MPSSEKHKKYTQELSHSPEEYQDATDMVQHSAKSILGYAE